jgi:hypothetical protein
LDTAAKLHLAINPNAALVRAAGSSQPYSQLTGCGATGTHDDEWVTVFRRPVLVGHLSTMHSSIMLIYHSVLATKWPISWQVTH